MLVTINSAKEIFDLTFEEKEAMEKELTLPNPAYQRAMQYSNYSSISIQKNLYYYNSLPGRMRVPRGYKIPFPHTIKKDERFTLENVKYPKRRIALRQTQIDAVKAYLNEREEGNGVMVIPTGKGKSILGLFLAGVLQQRVLVIVHKDDLVTGWKKDALKLYGIRPKKVGLIKAQTFRLGEQITISTIQTLSRLSADKLNMLREYFSMIIVDEFHHAAARIYEIIDTFPAKDRLGLTATDMRNDGLEDVLNFYFGNVCFRFEETDDDEDIIPGKDVTVIIRDSNIKYNPPTQYVWMNSDKIVHAIYSKGKYYYPNDDRYDGLIIDLLNSKLIKRKKLDIHKMKNMIQEDLAFNSMIAKDVVAEYGKQKSCLVFCSEKEHVRYLQHLITELGVPESKIQMYYGDAKLPKSTIIQRAEDKEVLITIATYSIATEGTNVKSWERIFLAMSFNNEKDAIQAIGRGRRRKEGKTELIVYDYRHPEMKGIRGHGYTRDEVYNRLGFNYKTIEKERKSVFNRGFSFIKKYA